MRTFEQRQKSNNVRTPSKAASVRSVYGRGTNHILNLQRTIGNQAVKRLKNNGKLQRKVEIRDVGRGEQSGYSRVPELIDRLNAMSPGVLYSLNGRELAYEVAFDTEVTYFDQQLMPFIDEEAVIPLRMTNRHGLLGDRTSGYHTQVSVDAWTSGYVDIDDLLASDDLGLQSVLLHFISERSSTRNYARRIGTDTFTMNEFRRVHAVGTDAEAGLLRDYFGDPTIQLVNDSPSPTIRRVFRNSRGDLIRRRVTIGRGAERGVDAMSIDVRTTADETLTAEEYRQRLEDERAAAGAAAANPVAAPAP
jgi:hypothetical protein